MGQDLSSYLDGLLYSDYLTYWDYIHLDTLLSLQSPKTHFPDETVFIIYHQITELYFRLVLHEIDQIAKDTTAGADLFLSRLQRIIRYFRNLTHSFEIMVEGLDKDQFLKFRMALLPSSGFQSAQYRLIEISSTPLNNLVEAESRKELTLEKDVHKLLEKIYWRRGATELASGKKTLTLQQFEEKYKDEFFRHASDYQSKNLWATFVRLFPSDSEARSQAVALLREYDALANVHWPLAHLKSAARYLHKEPDQIKATGGTNWQKYLPPRFQRIIFFPELWSTTENEEWGKAAFADR
jgi:tryptophan 2,3-dioxygenase